MHRVVQNMISSAGQGDYNFASGVAGSPGLGLVLRHGWVSDETASYMPTGYKEESSIFPYPATQHRAAYGVFDVLFKNLTSEVRCCVMHDFGGEWGLGSLAVVAIETFG